MIPSLEQLAEGFTRLAGNGPVLLPPDGSVTPADAEAAVQNPSPGDNPVRFTQYARQGYHLDVTLEPSRVVRAAQWLDRWGFSLDTITGVDWLAQDQMEVVYDYFHQGANMHVVVRARVPRKQPALPTICQVFPGANWHERETHDFFGIHFVDHPNLEPLLLPEEADYHPLKKDFAP